MDEFRFEEGELAPPDSLVENGMGRIPIMLFNTTNTTIRVYK